MTSRFVFIVLISMVLTNSFSSCKQSSNIIKKQQEKIHFILFDTSKTAIIRFGLQTQYPFDSSYKPAELIKEDLRRVDSLVMLCLIKYNKSVKTAFQNSKIDLNLFLYKRQLVAVVNKRGEKEVWLNYFCDDFDNNRWRTDILTVNDGGNCFFNLKINLTTGECYNLMVNGVA